MRTFSPDELSKILADHKRWVDTDGAEGIRADLSGAKFIGADLLGTYLRRANLFDADLTGVDLRSANLIGANLIGADLRGANLTGADLTGANLSGADLTGADLRGADLHNSQLGRADLTGADLTGANLTDAYLRGARMDAAEIAARSIVPAVGAFRGYKKVAEGNVVTLEIPADAPRCGGVTSRECRAGWARVVDGAGTSCRDPNTRYTPGAIVRAARYSPDPLYVCGGGIYFFMSPDEAAGYDFT